MRGLTRSMSYRQVICSPPVSSSLALSTPYARSCVPGNGAAACAAHQHRSRRQRRCETHLSSLSALFVRIFFWNTLVTCSVSAPILASA